MIRIDTFKVQRKDGTLWLVETLHIEEEMDEQKRQLLLHINKQLRNRDRAVNPYIRAMFMLKTWYRDEEKAFPITDTPKPYTLNQR